MKINRTFYITVKKVNFIKKKKKNKPTIQLP